MEREASRERGGEIVLDYLIVIEVLSWQQEISRRGLVIVGENDGFILSIVLRRDDESDFVVFHDVFPFWLLPRSLREMMQPL